MSPPEAHRKVAAGAVTGSTNARHTKSVRTPIAIPFCVVGVRPSMPYCMGDEKTRLRLLGSRPPGGVRDGTVLPAARRHLRLAKPGQPRAVPRAALHVERFPERAARAHRGQRE